MAVEWNVVATIAAPLIALPVGAFLNRAFESRPRLVTYLGHVSAHTVKGTNSAPFTINTHAVVLRNNGRQPATNVRLSHHILPDFNVHPDIEHKVVKLPGGLEDIVIPRLVPGEQVTISYLYSPPVTWNQINGTVKSDEGLATVLHVLPTPQFPKWVARLLSGLVLAGTVAVLYVAFVIIRQIVT